jgi:hypothetical protein
MITGNGERSFLINNRMRPRVEGSFHIEISRVEAKIVRLVSDPYFERRV